MNCDWITPEVLDKAKQLRILVVGDVILDRYIFGDVERTSPEAPVPVVLVNDERLKLGGAANVATNLASMEARVTLTGIIGKDAAGNEVKKLLSSAGISNATLFTDPSRTTTEKTRVVSHGQQITRIDREIADPVSSTLTGKICSWFTTHIKKYDIILVSDYNKGLLNYRIRKTLMAQCRKNEKTVIVDPKGLDYELYKGATFLTPNIKEAQLASSIEIRNPASLTRAAGVLLHTTGAECLFITRGKDGVSLFSKTGKPVHIKARAREVFDVTGAGDTFVAHLALGYCLTRSHRKAAEMATLGAGIVVGKVGAAQVAPFELLAAARETAPPGKYKTAAELNIIASEKQREGEKVVFTNGCFDLLHVGHVKFLHKARALGDLLIVALNSDKSVRALKGSSRPFIGEIERVEILSSLECVDYVTVFDEKEPITLIESLRPDVLVKGKNIKKSQVVGGDIVERYGGRVELLPFFHKIGTSELIESLLKNAKGTSK